MRYTPIAVVDGFYADETRPWSSQDVVNLLPTQAEQEGTRTPSMLKTCPGLKPYVAIAEGAVRNLHACNGRLFATVGTTLYRVQTTGSVAIGTIPGVTRVQSAHNQITDGNEVLFTNGSAGYIYNTVTDTLTKITDPGFVGGFSPVFLDGYFLVVDPSRRFIQMSDLADGTNWNTLDRFTSEVDPDPLVAIVESNNELLVLSEQSGEFFENTGATEQPFRSKRIVMEKGCAGRFTVAKMDNTVFWLGDDGQFYQLDGYAPRRISTRPIEQAIRGLNWSQAFAFVWEDAGHTVVYWTFPDGLTWGYDASTQKWHRRKSYELNRWRANNAVFFGQTWIVGDFQRGVLWQVDWDYILEGDIEIERERTCAVMHDNQNRVLMPRLEVLLGGAGASETIPPEPLFPNIPPSILSITGSLGDWVRSSPYSQSLSVVNPIGGFHIVSVSGPLPDGWSIVPDMPNSQIDVTWPPDASYPLGPLCLDITIEDDAGRQTSWSGCLNVSTTNFFLMVANDPGGAAGVTFGYCGDVGMWTPITGTKTAGWYPGQLLKVSDGAFSITAFSSTRTKLVGNLTTGPLVGMGYVADGGVGAGRIGIAGDSTYIYRPGNSSNMGRSANIGVSFSTPSVDPVSINSCVVERNGVLYAVRTSTRRTVATSSDQGANWTQLAGNIRAASPTGRAGSWIDMNADASVMVAGGGYTGSSGYLSWSINGGASFTIAVYPFGASDAVSAIKWAGGSNYVAFSEFGDVAYSANNGASWTLVAGVSPQTVATAVSCDFNGARLIASWDQTKNAMYSDDLGATWASAIPAQCVGVIFLN